MYMGYEAFGGTKTVSGWIGIRIAVLRGSTERGVSRTMLAAEALHVLGYQFVSSLFQKQVLHAMAACSWDQEVMN